MSIQSGNNDGSLDLTTGIGKQGVSTLYFDDMLRPNNKFIRSVLLALTLMVGSVQAQVSYSCGMMDMVIHDECCCADFEYDDTQITDSEPCCDKTVDLGVDTNSDQAQSTTKPIKFDSDVDPPTAAFCAFYYSLQLQGAVEMSCVDQAKTIQSAGSATYLITQRLRI